MPTRAAQGTKWVNALLTDGLEKRERMQVLVVNQKEKLFLIKEALFPLKVSPTHIRLFFTSLCMIETHLITLKISTPSTTAPLYL